MARFEPMRSERRQRASRSLHWRPAGPSEILGSTMLEENVEIVKGTIDSLNSRDLDQAVEVAHEDFEADWSNSIAPHRGVYRGRERARELFEAFLEAWVEFRWDAQEIIEVDRGAAGHRQPGPGSRSRQRGRGGCDRRAALDDHRGKVRSVKLYQSKADALEDVGLRD